MAEETSSRSKAPWLVAGALAVGAGAGLWLASQGADPAAHPAAKPAAAPSAPTPNAGAEMPSAGAGVAAPAVQISDRGRLSASVRDLREGDVMAVGLHMADESRGDTPRPVRIVDADEGRVYDTEAIAIDGAGTGMRLEIDPEWLTPGRYVIQVETAEQRPMALNRYVLEVTSGGFLSD